MSASEFSKREYAPVFDLFKGSLRGLSDGDLSVAVLTAAWELITISSSLHQLIFAEAARRLAEQDDQRIAAEEEEKEQ